jgi:hypothetical protein
MTKTYDRRTYAAARRAWAEGDFRDRRWRAVYRLAAERGYIYPPTGTVHDDRDDEQPSQRAIVYAAMCDQPVELERIMRRSSSWSAVVAQLITHVERLREDADRAQDDVDWERRGDPDPESAKKLVGSILRRAAEATA